MSDPAPPRPRRALRESTFALVANGFADGPAQALRDHLVRQRAARVIAVNHPLSAEEGGVHRVQEWTAGAPSGSRSYRLPSRPPFTYPLDLLAPPSLPAVDAWFGFNPLNVLPGLLARRRGRAGLVVYWGVDVSEARFGGGPLTAVYERLEGLCCRRAGARFELSQAMREARDRRHPDGGGRRAPCRVVPMGGWTAEAPKTDPAAFAARRLVYAGHLLRKQGLAELLEAIAILDRRGLALSLDVAGRGPEEANLRRRCEELGLGGRVRFLGFIEDHRELERAMAAGSAGMAPYATGEAASFTAYADPGKLKLYLAAGLPILTTRAAPVAAELGEAGAAVLVDFDPAAIAGGLAELFESEEGWRRRREAALEVARRYDWGRILPDALGWLGFD